MKIGLAITYLVIHLLLAVSIMATSVSKNRTIFGGFWTTEAGFSSAISLTNPEQDRIDLELSIFDRHGNKLFSKSTDLDARGTFNCRLQDLVGKGLIGYYSIDCPNEKRILTSQTFVTNGSSLLVEPGVHSKVVRNNETLIAIMQPEDNFEGSYIHLTNIGSEMAEGVLEIRNRNKSRMINWSINPYELKRLRLPMGGRKPVLIRIKPAHSHSGILVGGYSILDSSILEPIRFKNGEFRSTELFGVVSGFSSSVVFWNPHQGSVKAAIEIIEENQRVVKTVTVPPGFRSIDLNHFHLKNFRKPKVIRVRAESALFGKISNRSRMGRLKSSMLKPLKHGQPGYRFPARSSRHFNTRIIVFNPNQEALDFVGIIRTPNWFYSHPATRVEKESFIEIDLEKIPDRPENFTGTFFLQEIITPGHKASHHLLVHPVLEPRFKLSVLSREFRDPAAFPVPVAFQDGWPIEEEESIEIPVEPVVDCRSHISGLQSTPKLYEGIVGGFGSFKLWTLDHQGNRLSDVTQSLHEFSIRDSAVARRILKNLPEFELVGPGRTYTDASFRYQLYSDDGSGRCIPTGGFDEVRDNPKILAFQIDLLNVDVEPDSAMATAVYGIQPKGWPVSSLRFSIPGLTTQTKNNVTDFASFQFNQTRLKHGSSQLKLSNPFGPPSIASVKKAAKEKRAYRQYCYSYLDENIWIFVPIKQWITESFSTCTYTYLGNTVGQGAVLPNRSFVSVSSGDVPGYDTQIDFLSGRHWFKNTAGIHDERNMSLDPGPTLGSAIPLTLDHSLVSFPRSTNLYGHASTNVILGLGHSIPHFFCPVPQFNISVKMD